VKRTNTLKNPHAHGTEEHRRSAARKNGLADLPDRLNRFCWETPLETYKHCLGKILLRQRKQGCPRVGRPP